MESSLKPTGRRADGRLVQASRIAPWVTVVVGVSLLGAHLATDGPRAELLAAAAPMTTAIAVVVMVVNSRPARPGPWLLVAAGCVALAGAGAARALELSTDPTSGLPGAGATFGILAFPSLFVGVAGITSVRRGSRQLLAGAEPFIYALAATTLLWLLVTGPYLSEGTVPGPSDWWMWAVPASCVGLAVLVAFRTLRSRRARGFGLGLVGGLVLVAVGYGVVGSTELSGSFAPGSWESAAAMVGPLLLAVVLTTSGFGSLVVMSTMPSRAHWTQIFGLLCASLVPLAVLVLVLASGLDAASSTVMVVLATISVVMLALERMWRLVGQVRALTEQQSRERLAAMVEHSSDIVVLVDTSGRVTYASPGLRSTLGQDPDRWVGRPLVELLSDDEREGASSEFERLVDAGSGTVEFETSLVHADGHIRRVTAVIANLVGGSAVDGLVATFRDVTEQRNLERQLSHRAFHDELTGLANRALFLDRMDHALRMSRPSSDPVVVLFVDLDDFKSVNDALGHEIGDQLLRGIADRIRSVASSGDTTARLGGDEFALLLEDRGGIDRAIDMAESLLDGLREPVLIGGYEVMVLASVGVAVAAPGMTTTTLLRDADIAMYEAKRAGKGQIRLFDPAMRLAATKHLEYRSELAEALDRGQFRLVFMPYVDLRSGQVTGAEALVRWHHPVHGDVPAVDFVAIAERAGLIVPMGEWIIDRAFEQLAHWRPGLYASINISPVQIRQPDFIDSVIECAARRRIDPRCVVLEITETTLVEEGDRATETLDRLRDEGFRFAVDDFGRGYCSLSFLQRHPVDMLKVDRNLVEEFGRDPRGSTLARTILQTAESLDLLTVAEGIETTSQLRELRRVGCDLGQGYLLSRPLELDDLERRFGYEMSDLAG